MDVVIVITEYKRQLKAEGYAKSTIEGYRKNLDLFKRYLESIGINDLRTVTHQTIINYQLKIMKEPNAMETKALKIRPVKRLFEHLVDVNRLLINPTEEIIEISRKNRKIGSVMTIKQVRQIMAQPNMSLKTGIRDRAIMEVLYSTGIRLNELITLKVYDPDLKDKVLYIRKAKGKRQRVVPLGKTAIQYLKEYLTRIRPRHARKKPKERTLFLNHSGYPVTSEVVRSSIRKYRIKAKIKKPVSPHTFRRTCATHMLYQGADIRYIQKLLGHKDLKTTQTYTKIMPVDVKKIHIKTHPRLRFAPAGQAQGRLCFAAAGKAQKKGG